MFAQSWPRSASPNTLDNGLQVCTIMGSKCISWTSLDHGLGVYCNVHTIPASELTELLLPSPNDYGLPSASLNSLNHSFQLHVIRATKSSSKLAQSWPPSNSPSLLDLRVTPGSKSMVWFQVWVGTKQKPLEWVYPTKRPIRTEHAVFWLVPHLHWFRTLAPIKYMSSDRITILYIHKLYRVGCSFTSCYPLCHPINIHSVIGKNTNFFCIISQRLNEYGLDWTLQYGRRKSKQHCILYIHILLWYDQTSNNEL